VRERASRREVRVEGCHLLQLQSNGKKIKLYLSSIQSHMKIFSCLRLLQPTSHRCTPTLSKHVPSRLPIVIANAQSVAFFPTYVSCFKIAMPKKWYVACLNADHIFASDKMKVESICLIAKRTRYLKQLILSGEIYCLQDQK